MFRQPFLDLDAEGGDFKFDGHDGLQAKSQSKWGGANSSLETGTIRPHG